MSTTSRVVKNTGFLYVKMAVTMIVLLYTLRLLLASLGAADYGLFTIIGGAIAMLGFLNSTMAFATQRFMSYAEGEGNLEEKKKIFNISLVLHVFISIFTCLLLVVVSVPLFNGILNIQSDRVYAAKIVYCCLIFSTMLTIINAPYDAVLNAHENMFYYSIIGIFDSLLRLLIAFYCVYTLYDKLIVYGLLMALVPLITLTIMKIYCHRHYEECVIAPRRYWDSVLVKRIATFSGWNFLTAVSSLFTVQGMGLVLNHFYGTILNAAHGIAQQMNSQLLQFSANMMKALTPVIVKNAGAGKYDVMNMATIAGCKFSTYNMLLFAIPLMIEMPYVLQFLFVSVPDWTILFCRLQIVVGLIFQMADSASSAIYAQGNIKWYAIYKSLMNLLPLIIAYISFALGGAPYWLYVPLVVVWGIGGDIVIVRYAQKLCGIPVMLFVKGVLARVMGVSIVMLLLGCSVKFFLDESFLRLILCCLLTTVGLLISLLSFGMSNEERCRVMQLIMKSKK